MRFRTRAFLTCFGSFAVLLSGSSWLAERSVRSTVRRELQASLREHQQAIGRIYAANTLQTNRFLKVAGENAALKAGVELLLADPDSAAARNTVEDQLRELGEHMGFDYLAVAAPDGRALAGVTRGGADETDSQLVPLSSGTAGVRADGLVLVDGRALQMGSIPLDEGAENLGTLIVGARFELSKLATSAVLAQNGKVLESTVPGVSATAIERAMRTCSASAECTVRLNGAPWISVPVPGIAGDGAYSLRSYKNLDAAFAPVQAALNGLFATVVLSSVLGAGLCSFAVSQSIVRPIAVSCETSAESCSHRGTSRVQDGGLAHSGDSRAYGQL